MQSYDHVLFRFSELLVYLYVYVQAFTFTCTCTHKYEAMDVYAIKVCRSMIQLHTCDHILDCSSVCFVVPVRQIKLL